MISVQQKQPPTKTPQIPCLAMRPAQAAKALDISERTLRDRVADGIISCIRIGGVVHLPAKPLKKRLEELAKAGGSVAGEREKHENTT